MDEKLMATMGSSYFPDDSVINDFFNLKVFDDQSIVQFIHRNLAYLIVIIYFYMLYFVLKNGNINLKIPIFIIGISLLFQIVLGVLTILSGVKMIYASLPDKFYFNTFNIVFFFIL